MKISTKSKGYRPFLHTARNVIKNHIEYIKIKDIIIRLRGNLPADRHPSKTHVQDMQL